MASITKSAPGALPTPTTKPNPLAPSRSTSKVSTTAQQRLHKAHPTPLKPFVNRFFEPLENVAKTLLSCIYELFAAVFCQALSQHQSPFTPLDKIQYNPSFALPPPLRGNYTTRSPSDPNRFGLTNMGNSCFGNASLHLLFTSQVITKKALELRSGLTDKIAEVNATLAQFDLTPLDDTGPNKPINDVIQLCTASIHQFQDHLTQLADCYVTQDDGTLVVKKNKQLKFLQLQNAAIEDLYNLSGKLLTLSYLAYLDDKNPELDKFRDPSFIHLVTQSVLKNIKDLQLCSFCSAFTELRRIVTSDMFIDRKYEQQVQKAFWYIPGFFDYLIEPGLGLTRNDALQSIGATIAMNADVLGQNIKSAFPSTGTLHLFDSIPAVPFAVKYRVGKQLDPQEFLQTLLNRLNLLPDLGFGMIQRKDFVKYTLVIPPNTLKDKTPSVTVYIPNDHPDISLEDLEDLIENDIKEKCRAGKLDLGFRATKFNLVFKKPSAPPPDEAAKAVCPVITKGKKYSIVTDSVTDPLNPKRDIMIVNFEDKKCDLQERLHRQVDDITDPIQYTRGSDDKELHNVTTTQASGKPIRITTTASYYKQYLYIPADKSIPEETIALYGLFRSYFDRDQQMTVTDRQDDRELTGILNPLKLRVYHGAINDETEELDATGFVNIELRPRIFVHQRGSLTGGHYTAFESRTDGKLAHFNDSSATFVSKDSATTQNLAKNTYMVGYDVHVAS